jgi:hypothetical protein
MVTHTPSANARFLVFCFTAILPFPFRFSALAYFGVYQIGEV